MLLLDQAWEASAADAERWEATHAQPVLVQAWEDLRPNTPLVALLHAWRNSSVQGKHTFDRHAAGAASVAAEPGVGAAAVYHLQ